MESLVAFGISFSLIAVYILVFWASLPFVSIVIMNEITKNKDEKKLANYGIAVLVSFILIILKKIPVIGGIVGFIVAFAGMGIFMNVLLPKKEK